MYHIFIIWSRVWAQRCALQCDQLFYWGIFQTASESDNEVSTMPQFYQFIIMLIVDIPRFDPNLVPNIPDNLMIVDWFPQHDLLGGYLAPILACITVFSVL